MPYLALEVQAIQFINQIIKLLLFNIFCLVSVSEIFAEDVTKYKNAVILISNTITLDRETLTIPINSETLYQDLIIKVNSCFKLIAAHELISNLDVQINIPYEKRIYKNFLLHSQKPNLNSVMENSYFEVRLLDCHNKEEIILNEIYE